MENAGRQKKDNFAVNVAYIGVRGIDPLCLRAKILATEIMMLRPFMGALRLQRAIVASPVTVGFQPPRCSVPCLSMSSAPPPPPSTSSGASQPSGRWATTAFKRAQPVVPRPEEEKQHGSIPREEDKKLGSKFKAPFFEAMPPTLRIYVRNISGMLAGFACVIALAQSDVVDQFVDGVSVLPHVVKTGDIADVRDASTVDTDT